MKNKFKELLIKHVQESGIPVSETVSNFVNLTTSVGYPEGNVLYSPLIRYRLDINFSQIINCAEDDIDLFKDFLIKCIMDEIYGDLRNQICKMQLALYKEDKDELKNLISEALEMCRG